MTTDARGLSVAARARLVTDFYHHSLDGGETEASAYDASELYRLLLAAFVADSAPRRTVPRRAVRSRRT